MLNLKQINIIYNVFDYYPIDVALSFHISPFYLFFSFLFFNLLKIN